MWSDLRSDDITSVAISHNGNYIVAGSKNSYVYLYDRTVSTPQWQNYTSGIVTSVDISSDGEYLTAGNSGDGNIYLWDKDDPVALWVANPDLEGYRVAISGDGMYIFGASVYGNVYMYNKTDGYMWDADAGGGSPFVALSNSSDYAVVGSSTNTRLYARNGTVQWTYPGDTLEVSMSENGSFFAAGFYDKICLFNRNSSTPVWSYATADAAYRVAMALDGNYIAVGSYTEELYLFHRVDEPSTAPPSFGDLLPLLLGAAGSPDMTGWILALGVVGAVVAVAVVIGVVVKRR